MSTRDKVGGIVLAAVLCVSALILWRSREGAVDPAEELSQEILDAKHNLGSVLKLMLERRTGNASGDWPEYSGKGFVLSVVASGDLDTSNTRNVELLFSPGDERPRPPASAYSRVTGEALRTGTSFADLTSFVGRRNAERAYRITEHQELMGAAVVADLSIDGYVIVGYTNGAVRARETSEFGLATGERPIVGDAAEHPLLRALSDE